MDTKTCFLFDLDGTVTREEVLPIIASELGLENEMRLLTSLTMAGLIPFEDSFRLRYAILRHASLPAIHRAVRDVRLDAHVLAYMRTNAESCFLVTGNLDRWIEPLIAQIPCRVFCSTSRGGSQDTVGELDVVLRKNDAALELKQLFDRVVAIGDGFNDLPMFEVADVGIVNCALHSAPDELISSADYVVFSGESLCRLLNTL
jgi:HAD superfamily phosphoserine phosphatase-like hydrolase